MAKRVFACALALLILAGCQDRAGGPATEAEALEIANGFWAEEFPQVNLNNLTVRTTDMHDKWRVTYDPPQGSAGAQWILDVDKQTRRIVNVSGGQ